MQRLLRRLWYAIRQRRLNADLAEEMDFHRQMVARDLEANGVDPARAVLAAKRAFGSAALAHDRARDVWLWPWLQDISRDAHYGFRTLRKDWPLAVLTIGTLALGIASATVVFGVAYHVLVDPFPYANANRFVTFRMQNVTNVGGWRGRDFFTTGEFLAFRDQNRVFEDMIGAQARSLLYTDRASTRVFQGTSVTANTFNYLGVPPLRGRALVPQDGNRGAAPVFVMNYRLWQSEFGADPKIVGGTFTLNGEPRMLVGIMPLRFNAYGADVWIPAPADPDGGTWELMGRLRPGVSVDVASADLDAIAHRLVEEHFDRYEFAIIGRPFLDSVLGNVRNTLYGLMAAVVLLLLIACTNVASLLLARATAREQEVATRTALGATSGRVVRQLLVEGFILAAGASAVGCGMAFGGLRLAVALIPPGMIPSEAVIRMNAPVLLLSLGAGAITTLFCSLAPAWHLLGHDVRFPLAGSTKGSGGTIRHGGLRAGLVVTEVALSIVLLVSAGTLVRNFIALTHVDLGFNPENVLYIRPWFPPEVYKSADQQNLFTRQLLQRMTALPGVTSAAESMLVPPLTYDWSDTIIPGRPHVERWETKIEICSETYFQTLGLPLLQGRVFSEADVADKRLVVVVNNAFVRQYFPAQSPLGQRVKFQVLDRPFLDAPHDAYFEIVGIVGDYKLWANAWQPEPHAFLPYSVQGFSYRTFLARTSVDPNSLLKAVSREIWAIDPRVGIRASGSIEGSLDDFHRRPRFELATLGTFAGIGISLAVIGIFGVMAYTVSRRTHEIGIRMAIGARHVDVFRLILLKGVRLVASGIAMGLLISYTLNRLLAGQVYGLMKPDPLATMSIVAIVMAVGLAACWLPARRAMRVDVVMVLRDQ